MSKKRTGAPVTGTQVADGTDGSLTLPRIVLFSKPVSPCIITHHGQNDELLVKVNVELTGSVSETFAAPNLGHFVIPPKIKLADGSVDPPDGSANERDLSCGGLVAVHSVSFCTTNASDDLDDVSLVGWDT